ncbi:DEAD/DEAH box helicase [Helcobacillus massiliensis]|uniref:Superfamily II DNA or RNA helicase n=1 Tax=Helcobacillus massiliensis TaxID=521392 RepID=A0A839QTG4_9MICO|nr:DEAD/DEAH box helicase [Helcobacillus massiliensis]MBB3022050.1 superfamily II DNA or RNA helicase [Helcobacillus massiliensis]MCT1557421.1 DEAD/DEAH box helicase [Helcobacillus massiliensis]MCT2036398.1 DEAD/DEAH box helicase [Helcobacillus massiliensis]MCT2331860.1 DEAD/DEAH box helicase [Helcobacillus massiliensis]
MNSYASASHDPGPKHPSSFAAQTLPPAFPARAAWGTAAKLRAWQAEALELYQSTQPRDFLTVATPGAGKTTFALQIAAGLLQDGIVRRVTVVAPTEHLKTQWADSAKRVGIALDPNFTNAQGRHGAHFQGVAVTYAQVGANPRLHRARTEAEPTLVILDEIHHAGDALTWGDGVRDAFDPAKRRLSLTGTPFRSDDAQIPFVDYEPDEQGHLRSKADYTYGYRSALQDYVVRPVLFMTYSGRMHWRTKDGDEISAQLGAMETKDITQQAWRTALDPKGEWIPTVLQAADQRLTEVRRHVPDAGGLVIATDQKAAREYARILLQITGQPATLVLSDDATAGSKIEQFSDSDDRWMVAVRMVSEGVDVPRLSVGVYATSTATPMFFAQAVGRFVRSRTRGETASVFLPSVPILLALANELEAERDHVLQQRTETGDEETGLDEDALREANRAERASNEMETFEALESDAHFDRVLFDGGEYGTHAMAGSQEELDFLGIPGLLDADQVTDLLKERQRSQQTRGGSSSQASATAHDIADHRDISALRKELSSLVSGWAKRTGTPHGSVHNELRRRCGGPAVPQASAAQIQDRIDVLRGWFVGKK